MKFVLLMLLALFTIGIPMASQGGVPPSDQEEFIMPSNGQSCSLEVAAPFVYRTLLPVDTMRQDSISTATDDIPNIYEQLQSNVIINTHDYINSEYQVACSEGNKHILNGSKLQATDDHQSASPTCSVVLQTTEQPDKPCGRLRTVLNNLHKSDKPCGRFAICDNT